MSADTPQATNPQARRPCLPQPQPCKLPAAVTQNRKETWARLMRLCLRFRRFRNLFTIRPQVRNERTRALWGLANPRRVTRAVCGLRAVQPRLFAPHGQLMNRLHALPRAAGQGRRIGRKVWPPLGQPLKPIKCDAQRSFEAGARTSYRKARFRLAAPASCKQARKRAGSFVLTEVLIRTTRLQRMSGALACIESQAS